jgi:anti-sigma regulatory factor (Ser/Thr protein kinase)
MVDDATEARLALPADVSAPARARAALRGLAGPDPELAQHLALLATELVTNSLRHGGLQPGDTISLRASRSGRGVRVEVSDPGRSGRDPVLRMDDPRSMQGEGGLGLRLVQQVADDWGAERVPGDGVRAWFELRR